MPLLRLFRAHLVLVLVVLVILAARSSLADHYVVPSSSMGHTLLPGDRVLVDKRAYGLRLPFTGIELGGGVHARSGDIVIFDAPGDQTRMIKRVVAVAGGRVAVRSGHVRVNGRRLADPLHPEVERFAGRNVHLDLRFGGGPDLDETEVPAGRVLVMGDARGNSRDSRFFGFVSEDDLYARALRIYYRAGDGLVWLPL